MATLSVEEKLRERTKELTCLYEVSEIILLHKNNIHETLESICAVLKKTWRFEEDVIVELQTNDEHIFVGSLSAETIFQEANITVNSFEIGSVKMHYPALQYSLDSFLEEEQILLFKIAQDIGSFYEKHLNKVKEELLKSSAQRIDRLSILGEITAGIAHELNTPLGNILGFAEFIQDSTKESQSKLDSAKIIKSAVYSREVVKKLMFFSCEMPQNRLFVKIKPVVTQALSLLGLNFKKHKVDCKLIFDNQNLEAQVDEIQFTQVLFNILINSIYVAPENSVIEVKVYDDECNFFIEISDEGSGIAEAIKSKIFEPFFTTKPIGEGSGLGLSVVHGIIKSHQGDISTFDNQPKGTVFLIRLPLKVSV